MRAILLATTLIIPGVAGAAPKLITLTATEQTAAGPVSAELPQPPAGRTYQLVANGRTVPCQEEATQHGFRLWWIAPASSKGSVQRYEVRVARPPKVREAPVHVVATCERGWEFRSGGEVVARYDVKTGPNKPYFWPVNAPGGTNLMRSGPIQPLQGETTDHPHHRGLWFTHGSVNGVDYWSEGPKTGQTVNTGATTMVSGPVFCSARFGTDWIDPAGHKIAADQRDVRIATVQGAYIMDLRVVLRAIEPLSLGDTKEGSMGIRVPDILRPVGGKGHIINSEGLKDGATWGKRSSWVDYWGPVDGKTVGIAMMDTANSFRHPTYWHVRDYGLFAANPFGIHDFVKGEASNAGEKRLAAGEELVFSYRIILHKGDTLEADVQGMYNLLMSPPTVTVSR